MIDLKNEYEFQQYLISLFRKIGWVVEAEASTDETRSRSFKYREKIDILIRDFPYKKLLPMGIELKYNYHNSSAKCIMDAFNQCIKKYSQRHFYGKKLKTLVIGEYHNIDYKNIHRNFRANFLRNFGIGYLCMGGKEYLKQQNDNGTWKYNVQPFDFIISFDNQNSGDIPIKPYKNKYLNEDKILKISKEFKKWSLGWKFFSQHLNKIKKN